LNFKLLVLQNLLLALGIIFIHKFLSLKGYYQQIKSWKEGFPVIDGEGVGLTLFGIPLNDDGVHWTDIMGVANTFLTFGIIAVVIATGILIWKFRTIKA
jgi:hypothetical protein